MNKTREKKDKIIRIKATTFDKLIKYAKFNQSADDVLNDIFDKIEKYKEVYENSK